MKKKGYKFQKYQLNGKSSDGLKSSLMVRKSTHLDSPCGCGSGRIFKKCCYRSDHRIFNIVRYFDKLKNLKLRMHDFILSRFLQDEYFQDSDIQYLVDELSDKMRIPRFSQIFYEIKNGMDLSKKPEDIIPSAIHFETLIIDRVLPGHELPVFQEYLTSFLRKASARKLAWYKSYALSQFSLYEVIKVKKAKNALNYTWALLKNVFTGEIFEFKDPLLTCRVHIWDLIIGRRYEIAGFTLFSTSVFILIPSQQRLFNRILFIFCLKEEVARNSLAMVDIKSQYPQLFKYFSDEIPFLHGNFFRVPLLQAFLKRNSPVIIEILELVNAFSSDYPLIIKSPDGFAITYAKCKGALNPDRILDVVKILTEDEQHFIDISWSDTPDLFEFDYFVQNCNKATTVDVDFKPEILIGLSNDAIVHRIYQFLQKVIYYSTASIHIDWTMDEKVDSLDIPFEKSRVRGGFVKIKGAKLKLVTYSRESMKELREYIIDKFGSILTQISLPIFNNIQGERREKESDAYFAEEMPFVKYDDEEDEDDKPTFDSNLDDNDNVIDAINLKEESRLVKHYLDMKWLNSKIPALGGKSPKEAISDPDYFPLLLDLIKEIDNSADRKGEYEPSSSFSRMLNIKMNYTHFGNEFKQIKL